MKDTDQKDKFIELRAKGKSYTAVAKELGVCRQTAINWAKELYAEVHNARAMELDALYEKVFLTKEAKLTTWSSQLQRMMKEFETRDVSEIATDKLLGMILQVSRAMRDEQIDLRLIEQDCPLDIFNSKYRELRLI